MSCPYATAVSTNYVHPPSRLLSPSLDSLSAKIQRTLRESGIEDETILSNVANSCQSNDVFSHVSSRYQRETYYEKNFHYAVHNNSYNEF